MDAFLIYNNKQMRFRTSLYVISMLFAVSSEVNATKLSFSDQTEPFGEAPAGETSEEKVLRGK